MAIAQCQGWIQDLRKGGAQWCTRAKFLATPPNCRDRGVWGYFLASFSTKVWSSGLTLVCFYERTSLKCFKMLKLKLARPISHFCWMGGSLLGHGEGGHWPPVLPPPGSATGSATGCHMIITCKPHGMNLIDGIQKCHIIKPQKRLNVQRFSKILQHKSKADVI